MIDIHTMLAPGMPGVPTERRTIEAIIDSRAVPETSTPYILARLRTHTATHKAEASRLIVAPRGTEKEYIFGEIPSSLQA